MAHATGVIDNLYDLLDAIVDTAVLDSWTVEASRNATYDNTTRRHSVVLHGIGDGNDNIYVNLTIDPDEPRQLILDMSAGYDDHLYFWEQPGSIQQWNKTYEDEGNATKPMYVPLDNAYRIPVFSLVNHENFSYFIFTNSYRIIVVCRLSIDYQSFHVGLLSPISSEKQFPYPAYVAGNNVLAKESYNASSDSSEFLGTFYPNVLTNSFVFPVNDTGWLRRADGVWRSFYMPYSAQISATANVVNGVTRDGHMYPYICNNKSLTPNYNENEVTNVDFLLIPVILMTASPVDMCGLIRGVYWISGTRDVAAEQFVVIDDKQYMVFDAGNTRGDNSYFCVEIEQ